MNLDTSKLSNGHKRRRDEELHPPSPRAKKLARPSKDDCRGTVFNHEFCIGTKRNPTTYWCVECDKTKDDNRTLNISRVVKATDEDFIKKNKQFLHSCRCKRLKINDVVNYVLENAQKAKKVCSLGGAELMTPSNNHNKHSITYHWSGKQKKYIYGPKPNSRNPCIPCAKKDCTNSGNRSCEMKFCSKHCRLRGNDVKCGVHAREKNNITLKSSENTSKYVEYKRQEKQQPQLLQRTIPPATVAPGRTGTEEKFEMFMRRISTPNFVGPEPRGIQIDRTLKDIVEKLDEGKSSGVKAEKPPKSRSTPRTRKTEVRFNNEAFSMPCYPQPFFGPMFPMGVPMMPINGTNPAMQFGNFPHHPAGINVRDMDMRRMSGMHPRRVTQDAFADFVTSTPKTLPKLPMLDPLGGCIAIQDSEMASFIKHEKRRAQDLEARRGSDFEIRRGSDFETHNRDSSNRDSRHRDNRNRDSRNRDSRNRDSRNRDSRNRDSRNRDSRNRDSRNRDSRNRDSYNRDSHNRDSYNRDNLQQRMVTGGLQRRTQPDIPPEASFKTEQIPHEILQQGANDTIMGFPFAMP